MPILESILANITEKVFNYALDQSQSVVEDWVRKKLDLDPKRLAFKRALSRAYKKFEKQYPHWTASLFDVSFLENEGGPILALFLTREGQPNPSDLAKLWADSLNIGNFGSHTTLVRELE